VELVNKYSSKRADFAGRTATMQGVLKELRLDKAFTEVYVDKIYYLDFYDKRLFRKTDYRQMVLYAKYSQGRTLIRELSDLLRPLLEQTIRRHHIDAVAFVPHSVNREVQFMSELRRQLHLRVETIMITKIRSATLVPQKVLTKISDRIKNAACGLVIEETRTFNSVLLIDDNIASGATLNEIAKTLKKRNFAKTVIGLAITGRSCCQL